MRNFKNMHARAKDMRKNNLRTERHPDSCNPFSVDDLNAIKKWADGLTANSDTTNPEEMTVSSLDDFKRQHRIVITVDYLA